MLLGQTGPRDYPNQSAATPSTVTNEIQAFDPLLHRAMEYANRLANLHERIHGPSPTKSPEVANPSPPATLISEIRARREALIAILDDMERSINGLEGGL